jgi:steroid Delta-isomerase
VATPEELQALVARYAEIASSRDVDAYVALFTDDAVQTDPVGRPPNVGKEAIAAFRQSALDACEAMTFSATDVHPAGDQVAFHFAVEVSLGTGTMSIEGIEVFTVTDDGRLRTVDAYWGDDDVSIG